VIIPIDASPQLLAGLPHAVLWGQMLAGRPRNGLAGGAKSGPGPGCIRSVNLTNPRQTRLILGVMPRNASAFEVLSLAGRMARDLGGSTPGSIAVAAPTEAGGAQDRALEA